MKYFLFLLVLLVYLSATIYVFMRLWQALPALLPVRIVYAAGFVFAAVSLFVYFACRNILPSNLLTVIYLTGGTFLVVLLYLTAYFLVSDLILFFSKNILPEKLFLFNWRQIQVIFGCFALLIILLAGNYRFHHPKIVEKNISIKKENTSNQKLKIVAVSDLHIGHGIGKKRLAEFVQLINNQHPDIILIGGDLIDSSPRPLEEQRMYEEINQLNAPLGIFMCAGNHEYISGMKGSLNFLKKTKIKLLLDSVANVGNLSIIGRKDLAAPNRKTTSELMENIPSENVKILLDHQPYNLDETAKNGIDIQFSGHTHDGQFFPVNLIVKLLFELAHGYKQKDETHIIVSSGLGIWGPPYRIATQSELWVLNLDF
jgi:predicted MPP superfamily phosphohydrolase